MFHTSSIGVHDLHQRVCADSEDFGALHDAGGNDDDLAVLDWSTTSITTLDLSARASVGLASCSSSSCSCFSFSSLSNLLAATSVFTPIFHELNRTADLAKCPATSSSFAGASGSRGF